ncbi:hypothetical protein PU560_14925 [Georgenia sp. 10Sc9-8]|uniref:Uncharacterized protein n=1 Tax=Georgenia halotolerans TaxID=3028317 RepID=A0ABT5U0N3_9MICO|nr:hypothetical protein [Georgenia halotolerans]
MTPARPPTDDVPEDVAVARSLRALRGALLATVGACLVLGALAVGVVVLTGTDDALLWPGLSLLAVGQLLALVAAAVVALGLRSVLVGGLPAAALARTASRLRRLARLVVVACVVGVVVWGLVRPEALVVTVACALVVAQVPAVLHVLCSRTLVGVARRSTR